MKRQKKNDLKTRLLGMCFLLVMCMISLPVKASPSSYPPFLFAGTTHQTTELDFETEVNMPETKPIYVSGGFLLGDVYLTIEGDEENNFSLSSYVIANKENGVSEEIIVTFNPTTVVENYEARLVISTEGANPVIITLTGKTINIYTVSFDTGIEGLVQEPIKELVEGAGVILPYVYFDCGKWTFQGWSEELISIPTKIPQTLFISQDIYYPTENTELYAVYSKTEGITNFVTYYTGVPDCDETTVYLDPLVEWEKGYEVSVGAEQGEFSNPLISSSKAPIYYSSMSNNILVDSATGFVTFNTNSVGIHIITAYQTSYYDEEEDEYYSGVQRTYTITILPVPSLDAWTVNQSKELVFETEVNASETLPIHVWADNLRGDIRLAIEDDEADYFSLSSYTIANKENGVSEEITVTFNPTTVVENYEARLVISTEGANPVIITLTGKTINIYTVSFDTGIEGLVQEPIKELVEGAGVILPYVYFDCGKWTFQGWSEELISIPTKIPQTLFISQDIYYPTENTELYAVYSKTEGITNFVTYYTGVPDCDETTVYLDPLVEWEKGYEVSVGAEQGEFSNPLISSSKAPIYYSSMSNNILVDSATGFVTFNTNSVGIHIITAYQTSYYDEEEDEYYSGVQRTYTLTILPVPSLDAWTANQSKELVFETVVNIYQSKKLSLWADNLRGDISLSIEGDEADCFLLYPNKIVNNGESISEQVEVWFNPSSAIENYDAKIVISSQGAEDVIISLTGTAYPTPIIHVEPTSLDFGEVVIGERKTLSLEVTIENPIPSYIPIVGHFDGEPGFEFEGSYVVQVTFIPEEVREYTKSVEISYVHSETISNSGATNVPVYVKGKGVYLPFLDATNTSGGKEVDFDTEVNVPQTDLILVSGEHLRGDVNLTIEDDEAGYFSLSSYKIVTEEGIFSEEITVTFLPTAVVRDYEARVVISSEGVEDVIITLIGNSFAIPVIHVEPTSLDFGNVIIGESKTLSFEITIDNPIPSYTIALLSESGVWVEEFRLTGNEEVEGSTIVYYTFTPTEAKDYDESGKFVYLIYETQTLSDAIPVAVSFSGTGINKPILDAGSANQNKELVFETEVNVPQTLPIYVSGAYLQGDITLAIEDDEKNYISLSSYTIELTEWVSEEIKVIFNPTTVVENYEARLIVSSEGAENVIITILANSEEAPIYTISLIAESGTINGEATITGKIGSEITLPTATPTQICVDFGWTFAGWILLEDYLNGGINIIPETYTIRKDIELYALYVYQENHYELNPYCEPIEYTWVFGAAYSLWDNMANWTTEIEDLPLYRACPSEIDYVIFDLKNAKSGNYPYIEEAKTVAGVEIVCTAHEEAWRAIGFPFDVDMNDVYSRKEDKTLYPYSEDCKGDFQFKQFDYDVDTDKHSFSYSQRIETERGYIINFDKKFEENNIDARFPSSVGSVTLNPILFDEDTNVIDFNYLYSLITEEYKLIANPYFETFALRGEEGYAFYSLDNKEKVFTLLKEGDFEFIQPFQSFIAKKLAPGESPMLVIDNLEGDDTAIEGIGKDCNNDPIVESHYYDLQGVKVFDTTNIGVYIIQYIHKSGKVSSEKVINIEK
ncbi:hypothetical protein LJC06_00540 [Bacteroidales bacterium OttesenSCG-928-I14]|nr:hypothetical protein [Bacteroidales bacterium OttesenSCG-928-I14]